MLVGAFNQEKGLLRVSSLIVKLQTSRRVVTSSTPYSITHHQVAMNRCQSSIVTDPTQTMELLRVILQQEINAKIQNILNTYIGEWHKFLVMKYIWRI